ncbi:MAG: leucyl aminopeptidase family protein [Gammaproteobacteria bacterium]|nr:MAG: leucyl aminopeptidase family protein [Gammaproteobacteria bacterium]
MQYFYTDEDTNSIPIDVVLKSEFSAWKKNQSKYLQNWIEASQFKAKASNVLRIPNMQGSLEKVLVIAEIENLMWCLGLCAKQLPAGKYHINSSHKDNEQLYLGWGLGAYQYIEYKKGQDKLCKLHIDGAIDINQLTAIIQAVTVVRDMVNAPASDMMPQHISKECESIAQEFGLKISECIGDNLITENYPVIHAVGRASAHEPRLIEFIWGDPQHPRVSLIGKGVSFDSGGLDIKSAQGMRLMKKDMGGAAHAAGIALAVMRLKLPIQLQVLIPAVENAISGDAFRPGDVLTSRSGKTIEIDNTDAEGRLILCDAITKAVESKPDLLIDFATLTGAARVALGTEVPAFFTNDDSSAADLMHASEIVNDPIWQLPLHQSYRYMLNSDIADIVNSAASGYGGAITAALYLKEFVPPETKWIHFDVMAYNMRARAGRPNGGEAMGLRAVVEFLQKRYTNQQ